MRTDDLIQSLAHQLRPTPRHTVAARIAIGIGGGSLVSAVLLFLFIGVRPDLMSAVGSASYLSKVAYVVSMAAAALWAVARLARPDTSTKAIWILAVPFLIYIPAGLWELAHTDQALWGTMLLGHGWRRCTWLVLGLSLPICAGLWWAFRDFAPTHFAVAGAAAGICSGAIGAIIYCLHCPTDTAVFALAWYTLAFGLAGTLGALLGRHLMRW